MEWTAAFSFSKTVSVTDVGAGEVTDEEEMGLAASSVALTFAASSSAFFLARSFAASRSASSASRRFLARSAALTISSF